MTGVFYFFAGILVLLSLKSFIGGIRYRRYFEQELSAPPSAFVPFVTVIAPCRNVDDGLEGNLRSILDQNYDKNEVIFVVDDAADPAVRVIEKLRSDSPVKTKLVIAARSTVSSQKVENLREAVLHAQAASEAFVFVDSDVSVSSTWLPSLIAPLRDAGVGAATSYRWFASEEPTFAAELRSAWNASIASSLGPNTSSNFCWGGSMAIRRDVFDRIKMRERWHGTASDDFAVTRAMHDVGLPIVFVPAAMPVTGGSCTFGDLLEFTTRQMKITRVNAPKLWLMSLFGSAVFLAVLAAAVAFVLMGPENPVRFWAAAATLIAVAIFSTGKAWLRLNAVGQAIPSHRTTIGRQWPAQCSLWLVVPAIFLYNSLAALVSRRITWRGIRYELKSPHETVIITD